MVRVSLRPYPSIEFEGLFGYVAFSLVAFMVLMYAVLSR